ncbi:MAG: pilus assembly protein CpaC [Bradyrhizobiaceae bacterium]|jgi:Flp pilus assembly secretin CpaC|nr:MAG: pilus assembly protein CpaC [Bradyrhizobiaceae bacterium]
MSFLNFRRRASAASMVPALVGGLMLVQVAGLPASASEMISVNVDQARLVKFPDKIATIVVGNPLIADVTLQPGGMVVVTGKGYGATNVIAMDRTGAVLMDRVVQVEGPTDKVVTVYRGTARESYSCTPNCERRVTLGDAETYFKSTMEQAGAIGGVAASSGAAAGMPGKVN